MNRRIWTAIFATALSCGGAFADDPALWSLKPVTDSPVPTVSNDWAESDIDRFVVAKWIEQGIEPVVDADGTILVRRLYFNLIGLPPTPEQLAAFSKDGLERTVDQLLSSPRFGEKWARHWLDLARYSETNGADRNVVFSHAWRYRDWVIDAFNGDMPYNDFVRAQIAGDLLPDEGEAGFIATGFLTLGPKSFQEPDREKFLLDMVDEQIDTVSRSVLGLTVACSRCHDHKFDPIPQTDYYALAGIFLSSETLHGPGPLYFQNHQHNKPVVAIGPDKEELDPKVQRWRTEIYGKAVETMRLRSAGYKIRRTVTGAFRERGLETPEEDPELLEMHEESEAMYAKAKKLGDEREELMKIVPPRPAYAMAMTDAENPEDCQLREKGVHNARGEPVPRGRITIPGMPALDEIGEESGRRQLADWLVSEKNPLTARVFVNRVWYHLFGTGLVTSVDNFGSTGDEPTHPELLDYLAAKFMDEDEWSVKKLIRRIVVSRVWRLASDGESEVGLETDPGNRLYWRANLRRLDVEAFRDAMLFVGGELETARPENGSPLAGAFLGSEYGQPSIDRVNVDAEIANFRHRAVYLPVVRGAVPELYKQFDFADPNTATGSRDSRTIPAQALFLMNDKFVEERSAAAAKRILRQNGLSEVESLDLASQWISAVPFSNRVRSGMEQYLDSRKSELIGSGIGPEVAATEAWTDLFQVLFSGIGFRYLE